MSEEKGSIFEQEGSEEEFVDESNVILDEDHSHSADEHAVKVAVGDEEQDVYTDEGRESLEEDGEIAPWEEGFSKGASQRGESANCAHCSNVLGDEESEVFERKYNNRLYFFCSESCAESGPK